jgi:FAD:protein FMN transferase
MSNHPSRRDFLTLGAGLFVVAAVPWAAARQARVHRRTIPVMGTLAEVSVGHRDGAYAQRAIDAAFAELRAVEAAMSRFRADSEIGHANLGAGAGPVPVSAATAAVLARALEWAEASDGRFDPALGRAVAFWDVASRREPPAAHEVRRFAGQRLHREVELGRSGGRDVVLFRSPEIALDLGGIAKGYAVDRAVAALRDWGISSALVNAGGDLYALGRSPEGEAWQVGVRSPADPRALATTFRLEDRAVATSGDYLQFFEHAGRRYHHLLDPATGEPHRTNARSLTIAAADCMSADAAGTALFGLEPRAAGTLLTLTSGIEIVHSA